MDLGALSGVGKVTNEQEKVKPVKALPPLRLASAWR